MPVCLAADAQRRPAHVGILLPGIPNPVFTAFQRGMQDLGYVEGKNLVIEQRWAMGRFDDLPRLAQELVDLKVDVIVTATAGAALVAHRATQTIPIVIAVSDDPVGHGLAASLAHPGGNVTGLTMMLEELSTKRLELLKEAVPRTRRVAVVHDRSLALVAKKRMEEVAPALKMQLYFVQLRPSSELEGSLDSIAAGHYDALFVFEDPIAWGNPEKIAKFAIEHRLPGIYGGAKFVRAGGLISYAPSLEEMFKSAAGYVDRVLKGAKPADLPIEQPTKFELVVNLKTAKALGITIPESILLRADEVIR